MYSLFAFFIPSIIGVRINNYFNKELKIKNIIYNYITLLLFSFIINVLIMYNLFGIKENVFNVINSDTILFAEMAAISIIVNVILVFIGLVIQKNVMFKIEVEKNETKAKTVSDGSKKNTEISQRGTIDIIVYKLLEILVSYFSEDTTLFLTNDGIKILCLKE